MTVKRVFAVAVVAGLFFGFSALGMEDKSGFEFLIPEILH